MVRVTTLYLVQLCLFYGTNHEQAGLPQYVFRVDSCPCPNNISKWQDASKRLHCLHDLNSTDTGNAYHCLPSSYLNETVEFCGKGISVPPGHCPFYDYKVNADDIPDLYACNAFISGCPTQGFSSKDVYKFLSCLKINRQNGCYKEESDCQETPTPVTSTIPTDSSLDIQKPDDKVMSTIPTDSSSDIQKPDDKVIYISVIGMCLIGLIVSLKYLYKYKCLYQQMKMERNEFTTANSRANESHCIQIDYPGVVSTVNSTNQASEEELERLIPENPTVNSTNQASEEELERLIPENPTDMMLSNKCTSELREFDNLLEIIGSCVTDETWQLMRTILIGILDHKLIAKLNITRMLFELSKQLNLQYNVPFLESIFKECGELQLVHHCQKFTAENKLEFQEFQTNLMPCCGNVNIKFEMTKTGKESITNRVNYLRNWIGEKIQLHPGRILLTSLCLQTERIAVTFMMADKHANSVLDHAKTDDGQIDLFHKGVTQIFHDDNVFKIDKALKRTPFLQLHLSSNDVCENGIEMAASCALQRVGLPMIGKELYMRVLPSKQKGKEDGDKSSSKRKLIKKDRDSLLENFEPMNVCDTLMTPMFNENDITMIKSIKGRRQRAESFLEMCEKLPNEEFEHIFSSCLVKHLTSSTSVPNYDEIGPMRNRIQQNQEYLLDELDSLFIKATINNMEDVSEGDIQMWCDPQKSRKEQVQIFLKCVQLKDDYVIAFHKTANENGIPFPE